MAARSRHTKPLKGERSMFRNGVVIDLRMCAACGSHVEGKRCTHCGSHAVKTRTVPLDDQGRKVQVRKVIEEW